MFTLSIEQFRPVHSDSKYNVCCAVPGSGKTTVLVARAERLAKAGAKVLVVTFSNKAANDVEHRIVPEARKNITVKTIHAYCYDIIRSNWPLVGEYFGYDDWPKEASLATENGEKLLYQKIFGDSDFKKFYKDLQYLRSLCIDLTMIPGLMNKGVYFGTIKLPHVEKCIRFEHERLSSGMVLFDDMISLVGKLLHLPNISSKAVSAYEHLLVDEAQDTNSAQWDVLRVLLHHCETNLVVGDVNQAIYGFRGAEGSGFKYFINLPCAVLFTLQRTYRSRDKIVRFANFIVPDKISKIITNKEGGDIRFTKYEDLKDEVSTVVSKLKEDTCILARTNDYLIPFEAALIEAGIPYKGDSLYRSGILSKVLATIDVDNPKESVKERLIWNGTTDDELKVLRAINKSLNNGKTLDDLIQMKTAADALVGNAVTLSTGHAAKGLEWNHVFIVGANRGMIPHKLATDLKEEKNLFYVMVTRGRESVEVSYTDYPSDLIKEHLK